MRGHYIKNRRDLNEPQIFDIIRSHGIQVYPTDQPADAVCGFSGMTFLVEVKNGPKAKTLEWDRVFARLETGCYYQALQSQTGKTWCVSFVYRYGSDTLGYYPTFEEAKAAAQAHFQVLYDSMGVKL